MNTIDNSTEREPAWPEGTQNTRFQPAISPTDPTMDGDDTRTPRQDAVRPPPESIDSQARGTAWTDATNIKKDEPPAEQDLPKMTIGTVPAMTLGDAQEVHSSAAGITVKVNAAPANEAPQGESKAPKVGAGRREDAVDEAFVADLDTRMAKSDLKELGWRDRDDLDGVMRDLERLAGVSWQRAATLWDKYRPGDEDKPLFIDGDDKDPAQMPGKAPRVAIERPADPSPTEIDTRGDTSGKSDDNAAKKVVTPKSLLKRYVVAENKFYFRDDPNLLAFEDTGKRLATEHNDPDVAKSMVELAEAKRWTSIKVKGTEEFKREVWLAGSLRGMDVQGYLPRDVDKARLEELRQERQPRVQNAIEQGHDRHHESKTEPSSSAPNQAKTPTSLDKSHFDEPPSQLTKEQRIAVDTLRAILTERGDSARAVEMAATLAAERFQQQRVHVGRLVAHGSAPYQNKPDEKANYYVTLKTINGEKTIWGVDLERAMSASDIKKNDDLAILYQGKNRVTVKVNERDAEGKPTGKQVDTDVSRNTWEVNKLDKMREEVQVRLRDAARRSVGAQPVLRVYDVAADRKPAAAREPVKQRDQEQSPSR